MAGFLSFDGSLANIALAYCPEMLAVHVLGEADTRGTSAGSQRKIFLKALMIFFTTGCNFSNLNKLLTFKVSPHLNACLKFRHSHVMGKVYVLKLDDIYSDYMIIVKDRLTLVRWKEGMMEDINPMPASTLLSTAYNRDCQNECTQ